MLQLSLCFPSDSFQNKYSLLSARVQTKFVAYRPERRKATRLNKSRHLLRSHIGSALRLTQNQHRTSRAPIAFVNQEEMDSLGVLHLASRVRGRSEERRVGKECRSR